MAITTRPSIRMVAPRRLPPASLNGRGGWEREPFWKPLLGIVILIAVLVPFLAAGTSLVAVPVLDSVERVVSPYASTPLPKPPPISQTTYVYDRNGKLMARLHAGVDRVMIPFSKMPDHLLRAVISIEDQEFYRHRGVSAPAILRAALKDLSTGRIAQGGSTITQQYVKNVYTGSEKSIARKIREAILAMRLERRHSKNEILERYLNTVYFGNGAYGVQAAALTYFGVAARKLTVPQAAMLAGLIAAPSRYDPFRDKQAGRARRNLVLQMMTEEGYLTPEEAARYQTRRLGLRKGRLSSGVSSYFVQYVTKLLVDRYGYDRTFEGGLRVKTTMDGRLQQYAEQSVNSQLPYPTDPAAALVAIDPRTGEILALVGGKDFKKVKFNLAVQARRQTGSAFKVFTLATAMEQGISPRSVWRGPSSITITDPRCMGPDGYWRPRNYGDASVGTMDLVSATAGSVNTIFAQLVTKVGPDAVARVARRMGIRSTLQPFCSITLGSQAVTPLEMTSGYATLAADGMHHAPRALSEVKEASGDLVKRFKPKTRRALEANVAALVTHALQRVVLSGTGTAAALGRPVAGKTGTAQDYVDAWFCGYVPQLAACVWVGYPKAETPMHYIHGFPNVYGGSIPARIWHDFMARALEDVPVAGFPEPDFSTNTFYPTGTVPHVPRSDGDGNGNGD